MNLRVSLWWAILALAPLALAQDSEPLSEAFLLFLAEGVELDGEWQDPVTIAATLGEITGVQNISDDEVALITQQRAAEQNVAELREIEDGEDDE